jgi:ferredoxin-NADP reductase/cbb3-type cytochrome oxidase subunit 3
MNPALRKKLLWLHTWTGLTVGLVLVLLALTGAGMVLRPSLDDVVNRDLMVVPECTTPLPLDQLAKRAVAFHPAGKLHSLEVTSEPTASVLVKFQDKDQVFVDPCTGHVLGQQNQYGGYFGVVDYLHRFRFLEEGRVIAGWCNLFFLVLLIGGGVWLWWPKKGQSFARAARFNFRLPGIARTLSLHRSVGIYSSVVLLVLAFSALPISFIPVKNWVYRAAGYVEPTKPKAMRTGPMLSMEELLQRTRAAMPEAQWAALRYPPKAGDSVEVEILERDMPHADAKSYLYLDPATGQTLSVVHYLTDMGLGRKAYLYFIAVHSGLVGGIPYQLVLLVGSLALVVQAYSGFSPYLRRKLRRSGPGSLGLRLARRTPLTPAVTQFEFVHPAGKPLPRFTAGSHIEVSLRDELVRQYSLCNDPQERHRYVISVLRHADSRGGSQAMHEQLKEGDTIEVHSPRNFFPLQQGAGRSALIAGGIGITPLMAMARQLARDGRDFHLHYCVRSRSQAAFAEEIARSNFSRFVTLHVTEELGGLPLNLRKLVGEPAPDAHLYTCGPAEFMQKVLDDARRQGWNEGQLHKEHFAAEVKHFDDDTEFDVKLARSGKIVHVPKHRTVAAVLAECGVELQTSCEMGVCGTCVTRVIAGQADHRDQFLTQEERARNDFFAPCCSRSHSRLLVVDL